MGHHFQGWFKAILVERDAYLLRLARCVVLNPVRAGMVNSAADWPWRSFRATAGLEPAPSWLDSDWILGQFAGDRLRAEASFAAFVSQGIDQSSVWDELRHQVFFGGEAFVERYCATTPSLGQLREVPRAQRRPFAEPLADMAQRYPAREAMARAYQAGAYSMREIADCFGVCYSAASRVACQQEAWIVKNLMTSPIRVCLIA